MQPFSSQDIQKYFSKNTESMGNHIRSYTQDTLLANDKDQLVEECYKKFYIEPATIHDEDLTRRSQIACQIERQVSGVFSVDNRPKIYRTEGMKITFVFPVSGDIFLFKCRSATQYSYSPYPEIEVMGDAISFSYPIDSQLTPDIDQAWKSLMKSLSNDRSSIQVGLNYTNNDVQAYNKKLLQVIEKHIVDRRDNATKFQKMALMLQIPLTKSQFGSTHIPLIRREVPLKRTVDREKSYYISNEDYAYIIDTIKHNCSTYERTPESCAKLQEEDLRNFLLAALNGMFKGAAGGETFRKTGKTDICIEQENRAAFVAECKMWSGKASIPDALSQLIGYLTWRDCKCALIYFCKVKDFKKICETAYTSIPSVPGVSQLIQGSINEMSFRLPRPGSIDDFIDIKLLLYDLHIEK